MIELTTVKARFEALKRVLNNQGEVLDASHKPESMNPFVRYTLVTNRFSAMIQYYHSETLDMEIVDDARDEGTAMGGVMETLDDVDQKIHEFMVIVQSLMDTSHA